ncbi:hypothetical protein SFRURICE_020882 [Spodoptera frugiperda]|nr:hypothetical protein SFRURICE_020882 [Spodoptera frugiperda]
MQRVLRAAMFPGLLQQVRGVLPKIGSDCPTPLAQQDLVTTPPKKQNIVRYTYRVGAEGRGGPRAEEQAAMSEPPQLRLAGEAGQQAEVAVVSESRLRRLARVGPPEPRSAGAVTETMLACMLHACLHAACLLACLHAACLLACMLLACLHAACLLACLHAACLLACLHTLQLPASGSQLQELECVQLYCS